MSNPFRWYESEKRVVLRIGRVVRKLFFVPIAWHSPLPWEWNNFLLFIIGMLIDISDVVTNASAKMILDNPLLQLNEASCDINSGYNHIKDKDVNRIVNFDGHRRDVSSFRISDEIFFS